MDLEDLLKTAGFKLAFGHSCALKDLIAGGVVEVTDDMGHVYRITFKDSRIETVESDADAFQSPSRTATKLQAVFYNLVDAQAPKQDSE